ncbi:AraC family two component transcriptional regulator [Paenibacillus taihuensis]|uniref:AraC family two component transcriptional regulator n=1 Tax=Paenibacillus taihuensis TaxID=1156355 RepID=A0A3D9SE97_9BACL|nr:response regulator [Paenibacillus taihuensis]REE92917.1 AraC family two component transcriptional regulator [Paenibacillus taihuensis]
MYSMLIVDDEKWVRQGLKQTIDWQAHGVELWGEAQNGEEAFTWLSRSRPDIVITDIKMPGMDGLTLLEYINKQKLHTKVIIISGYSDFSYAQKAVKCGAYGYVLKPIEERELLEIVHHCVEDLDNDQKRVSIIEEMQGQIRESIPLARQRYLEQLLRGESESNVRDAETIRRALQLPLNSDEMQVAVIRVFDWGYKGEARSGRSAMLHAIGVIAEKRFQEKGYRSFFCKLSDEDGDAALVFLPEHTVGFDNKTVVSSILIEVLEESRRALDMTASIGLSQAIGWEKLASAYTEAVYACSYSFFKGKGKLYDGQQLPPYPAASDIPTVCPSPEWDNRVTHAIKTGDSELIRQTARELQQHIEEIAPKFAPLHIVQALRILLANLFYKLKGCLHKEETVERSTLTELLPSSFQLEDLSSQLASELTKWSSRIRETASRSRLVELGLEYIGQHFTRQITLQDVSNHLYVNASYFSRLFHEEMGETFVRYVAGLRISKAKQLLKGTTKKIYEIADEVGYSDFRHFVKTFKELVGLTPTQYRDSI